MEYSLLRRNEIDEIKWDGCIKNAYNESPLGYSSVLDLICENWYGLIVNDYELVMPIPITKRFGWHFIQMPAEIQNLGVFHKAKNVNINIEDLPNLPCFKPFRLISYSFVYQNIFSRQGFKARSTHYLQLGKTYDELRRNYEQRHRSNIRKVERNGISLFESNDPTMLFLIRNEMAKSNKELKMSKATVRAFKLLILKSTNADWGTLVYAAKDGKVISGGFFLQGRKRDVFLLSASLNEAKKLSASFGIVDYYIRKMSGQNRVLDLSGSDIKGIALFLRGFGSIPTTYYQYEYNRLPRVMKFVKKYNLLRKLKTKLNQLL